MKILLSVLICILSYSSFSQQLAIKITEKAPYKINQEITVNIYMTNTDTLPLIYFDTRGSSWDSFIETWDMNANAKYIEVLPLNNAWDNNFADSTILSMAPDTQVLIRTHKIKLTELGYYSLTYSLEQAPKLVQQRYADSDSTFQKSQQINTFSASANIKFQAHDVFDTAIHDTLNMTWDEWKDYRVVKMYSRKKHFQNINAAFLYPQDVYSLHVYCNKLDSSVIKRIGTLKNLKALTLRNYELDFFPKELAELNLYELTLLPKNETPIRFEYGISKNNTIRELTTKVYGKFPKTILNLKKLEMLDVSDCSIDTLPDLSDLLQLEKLKIYNANTRDISQANLNKLPKLIDLNLSGNKELNDINPLLTCLNLEFLELNRTSIPAIPHDIENLSKLKRLTISNKVTTVSDSIGNLSDMRYLSLGGNRSLDSIPNSILKLTKLLHLDVSSTRIPQLPEGISELPLERVMIYNTDCETTKDYKILRKRLGEKFKE